MAYSYYTPLGVIFYLEYEYAIKKMRLVIKKNYVTSYSQLAAPPNETNTAIWRPPLHLKSFKSDTFVVGSIFLEINQV